MINSRLSVLLAADPVRSLCKHVEGDLETCINGVSYSSKNVQEGFLFVAVRGYTTDGHLYIDDAIQRGAKAILAEEDFLCPSSVVKILVSDSRKALSAISSLYYGNPTSSLQLVGVTGTNGKTTVTYLVKDLLSFADKKVGMVGTTGLYIANRKLFKSPNTTPESADIHKLACELVEADCNYLVMEVTSHALDQQRVDHCDFAVGVFTNLSDEHLDWHQSMDNYFKSKAHLFELLRPGSTAVINIDDSYGAKLRDMLRGKGLRLFTCGQNNAADIMASNVQFDQFGNAQYLLSTPAGQFFLKTRLFGRYNIDNVLAAVGCGLALNISLNQIVMALSVSAGAPGRFQRLDEGQDFSVIIDYAHTPDGFDKLFSNIRRIQLPGTKLIVVFGCAGFFRDPAKRPTMGRIASEFADIVVLTEEDSRNEDAWQIMGMIETGINKNNCEVYMIEDRADAIEHAVSLAKSGDILLILGKGDENSMDIKHPSSWNGDVDTTRRALQKILTKAEDH